MVVRATTSALEPGSRSPGEPRHPGGGPSPPPHRWRRWRSARCGPQPVGHRADLVVTDHDPQRLGLGGAEQQPGELVGTRPVGRLGSHGGRQGGDHRLGPLPGQAHLRQLGPKPGRARHGARQAQPAHGTERVDVGGRARVGAEQHLGRDVAVGTPDPGRDVTHDVAEPEVAEHRTPVEVEQHVAGRDVAVHHPEVVQPPQRGGQRGQHRDHLPRRQVAASPHECVDSTPEQVRHHDGHPPVGQRHARLDRDDVRVGRPGGHRRLAGRHLERPDVGVHHLDRDPATAVERHPRPHLARATAGQQHAELVPGHVGHRRRVTTDGRVSRRRHGIPLIHHHPTLPGSGCGGGGLSTGP